MTGQQSLELWPRDHDLPPRWDGRPVEWGEWSSTGDVFICPPTKDKGCEYCRSTTPRLMCLGRIFTEPGTVAAIGRARQNCGRHLVGHIAAFRCPDCERDYVIDGLGADAQTWHLDDTDYTDNGSWEHR